MYRLKVILDVAATRAFMLRVAKKERPFDEDSIEAFFQEKLLSTRQLAKISSRVDTKPKASGPYQHWYKNLRGPWSQSWNFQGGPKSYVPNKPMRQNKGSGIGGLLCGYDTLLCIGLWCV
ncbi:6863_t:CDS:2 [Gigaspora margarita]|uniref:6863_t:CDS:1 n=1 Tax=Gigaspora margarita TaxID=4874 RepID=A0ABN7UG23_GIGMA|nr:6863_t:CDS:2 [Gigaspora margarita]